VDGDPCPVQGSYNECACTIGITIGSALLAILLALLMAVYSGNTMHMTLALVVFGG
jgi:hypothetical protein